MSVNAWFVRKGITKEGKLGKLNKRSVASRSEYQVTLHEPDWTKAVPKGTLKLKGSGLLPFIF